MFKSNHKNQKSFELFLSASMHFIFLNTRHFSLSITRRVRTFSITTTPPHRDSRLAGSHGWVFESQLRQT